MLTLQEIERIKKRISMLAMRSLFDEATHAERDMHHSILISLANKEGNLDELAELAKAAIVTVDWPFQRWLP